jgi:hypothetical protein
MRVTTNRTSKLQTATRTKASTTTILNEQTGHLQNGTTIVSPTSSNNVLRIKIKLKKKRDFHN